MPKDDIDYSNTIIYKIICNDKTINDLYVGHTTNFTKRKYLHKYACTTLNNKFKIYNTIRQNGGWDNWNMTEISTYNCKNRTEARIKEQQHYDELKANLNSYPPFQEIKHFYCKNCNYNCCKQSEYTKHILTNKHKNLQNPILEIKHFYCEICNYNCCKQSEYTKHILTDKHKNLQNPILDINSIKTYICNCGKVYKHYSTLHAHKKKCIIYIETKEPIIQNNISNNDESQTNNLLIQLIKSNNELQKENQEFKNLILEIIKKDTYNTNNTTNNNTNSHNKAFNLNFFLNETCKDAMNIMDFVDSIQLQLSDLENVGKLGYVEGISNIIIKNLKELDVEKRPVHCTDKKRETMYVKDENKWEKDEENNKIRKAIKRVVSKNQRVIPRFKEAHPDCNTYHSKFSDQYNKLILESCGGSGDNDLEKEEKIIKNISKNVLVDK